MIRARSSLARGVFQAALVALLTPGSAGALAPSPALEGGVRLAWRAPSGCPTAAEVQAHIERLLGRPLAALEEALTIDAQVIGRQDGWFAAVELRAGLVTRRRELRARRCEELADAFVLVVAIFLDPSAALPEPDAAEIPEEPSSFKDDLPADTARAPPAAPPAPAPSPVASVATEPSTQPRQRGALHGSLGAAYTSAVGPVPGYAPGGSVVAGLTHQRLRVELLGAYFGGRPLVLPTTGVRATFDLWWVATRGCGLLGAEKVEIALCGGIELGRLRGEARGVEDGARAALPWVAADAGATIHLFPGQTVSLGLGVDLAVPLVRPGFTIENLGEIHRAAPLAGLLHLGVELRIPRLPRR